MSATRISDRRQGSDRRQTLRDRRKQADGRCAVFEVCRSTLHLALVVRNGNGGDSDDRVVTRSVRWRNNATSLSTEAGESELAAAFRTLVADERLIGATVRIALGGEYCVTRVITGATDDVRREFSELEERSLRYLTLGPGRKALANKVEQLDARHQYAVLAVASQRTLDLLMRIADVAGLQIEAIEPSLIALSRAQAHLQLPNDDASLIVQLDEGVAELGICHQGRLLLEYRPGGHNSAENVAEIVAQHHLRLLRYVQRYHSYLKSPLQNVYLAGAPDAVDLARLKFEKLGQFRVHVVEPRDLDMSWQYVGEPPRTDLAAALGTAISLYANRTEDQGPNLIANTLAQLREPIRPILIKSLAPLAGVLLIAVVLFVLRFNQRRELAALQLELDQLTPICARANELRLKLISGENKLTELQALERSLPHRNWQQALSHIGQCMPDDVWLDRLSVIDGRSAALSGASYTDGGVYDFVGYLKDAPEIAKIALEGTGVGQSMTGPITNFNLQLTLADLADRTGSEAQHD